MALVNTQQLKASLPIRLISIGAMQKRFWVEEEVLILDGTDTKAKVIRERLFNSQ